MLYHGTIFWKEAGKNCSSVVSNMPLFGNQSRDMGGADRGLDAEPGPTLSRGLPLILL